MSLWGKSELIYKDGRVSVHFAEKQIKRHSGTIDFVAAGIKTGDIITVGTAVTVGAGSTVGFAIVNGIVGVHTLTVYSTEHLVGSGVIQNQDYYINEKPKYVLDDSTYDAPEVQSNRTVSVVGVDVAESGIAKTTSYAVEHAGWVGIQTYTDMHGKLRVKSETLVAFSGITSDRVTKFVPGFEQ